MRIGLISDTHIPVDAKILPGQIKDVFRGVDLILHAGDVYEVPVLDELERIAPLLVARGDDDFDLDDDGRVKEKHSINFDGISISLAHFEPGIGPWSVFPDSMEHPGPGSYKYQQITHVIVFGHTHMTKLQNRGGFLFLNPGSATWPYYIHRPGTVALLTIGSDETEVRIVQLGES